MRPALLVCLFVGAVARRYPFHASTFNPLEPTKQSEQIQDTTIATAIIVDTEFRLVLGKFDPAGVAWAQFNNTLNNTGWGVLDIHTSSQFPDNDQAFAAGFLEGALTASQIYVTQANLFVSIFKGKGVPPEVSSFLDTQEQWARSQISENPTDPFWRQTGYVLRQYDGLVFGYTHMANQGVVPPLDHFAFQMLNGVGDLFDIIPAVVPETRIKWYELDLQTAIDLHARHGHCSALIKTTGNFSDIFMAHSSWYVFANTNRIFKHYSFSFNDPSTSARQVSFSSYPGFLESLDDFYLMSSGLGMVQTSNGVLDTSVYDQVHPQSLLAWQRVRVAAVMATSGPEWHQYFSRYHSGTYANQYMIVNYNLFVPGQPLVNDTLWIVEEMPGLIVGGDQTQTLARGYWPSYNIPFWQQIYEASGYPEMVKIHGTSFTYQLAPRAQIFRRDQASVEDLTSLKRLLRSNNFHTDPYSFDGDFQNPMYAICSRGDLAKQPSPFGCYDTKVTSFLYGAKNLKAQAINGPTTNGGTLSPFSWANFETSTHIGLPPKYVFDFVNIQPVSWSN